MYINVQSNEHSLCIIYEKRPKKESRRNGEGSSVEQQPNLQIEPPLPLMTATANPNYASESPSTAAEAAEGWDLADDYSKYGWFGFGDMTTYHLGSLDFSDDGKTNTRTP